MERPAAAAQKDAAHLHVQMGSRAAEINFGLELDFQLIIIFYYNSTQSKF